MRRLSPLLGLLLVLTACGIPMMEPSRVEGAPPAAASASPTAAPEAPAASSSPADGSKGASANDVDGKLLTRPQKGSLQVALEGKGPAIGDEVHVIRPQEDGFDLLLADAKVTAAAKNTLTLRITTERTDGGDVYVPGQRVRLSWSPSK